MGRLRFGLECALSCLGALAPAISPGRASGQSSWVGNCGGTDWYEECVADDACGPDNDGCLNNWFDSPGCGLACPLVFPGPGDAVAITTGNGVSLNGNATIAGLDCQKPFTLSGTLTVNGAASFTAPVNWNSDGMLGAGTTTTSATLYIATANTKTLQARMLRANGDTIWSGTGTFDLSNGAVFENHGVFAVEGDALMSFSFGNPATFNNNGSFVKQNSAGETLIQGVIFNNAGSVSVSTGRLRLATTGTSTGSFHIAEFGDNLILNNDYTFASGTSLTGQGVMLIDGATVSLAADVVANRTTLNSGSIIGPGAFTCSQLYWYGGSMAGPGATVVSETELLGSSVKTLNGRTLTNLTATVWPGNGTLDMTNGAMINNGSYFSVRGTGALIHSSGAPSTFTNTGTFEKTTSAGVTLVQDVVFNNSGTVDVKAGTLRLTTTGTSSGTFLVAMFTAVEMGSGSHTLDGAAVTGDGFLRLNGATVTVAGSVSAGNVKLEAGSLTGAGALTCYNSLQWTGGIMTGPGLTSNTGEAYISGAGLKTDSGRTFNNNGNVRWSDAGSLDLANGATFNNDSSFVAENDATMTHSSGAPSTFNNKSAATFRKSNSTGVTLIQDVIFNNLGTVDVRSGTLRLTTTGTSTGTFSVAAGAKIEMGSGSHTLDAAAVTGDGSLRLAGATVTVSNDVSATNVALAAGVLTGTGTLACEDSLEWISGTMTGAGETLITKDATATLTGGFLKSAQMRTLTNEGLVIWTDGGTLDLSNGATFFNVGTFELFNDALVNFSFGSAAAFNNLGTFTKLNSGGETQFVGVPFNNSGQVEVQTGTLRMFSPYTQTNGATTVSGGAMLRSSQPISLQGGILGGTGTVNASVQNTGAEVSPGMPVGTLTVTGNYTQSAGGTLRIELGGPTPGTEHDQLAVTGTASLGGALVVELIDGFVPGVAQSFTILTAGSVTGTFATVTLPPGFLELVKSPTAVIVGPCDLDSDGDWDLDDYGVFAGCMNGPGSAPPAACECADADHDGDTDLADFAHVQIARGAS